MRAMLPLSVWNCQVKYFYLHKFTVPVLMVLRLNYWRAWMVKPEVSLADPIRAITSGWPTTRSEYAGRERHFSIQLVLPRTVRRRCLGCQECQSKSKTGHASSAPACDLYAFLVTVQ